MRRWKWIIAISGAGFLACFAMASGAGADGSLEPMQKGVLLTMLGIALGTLVSEDLACIGAGLLAASGQLDFFSATLASFIGIFVGDLIIFWLGYHFGHAFLAHPWTRWFISERAVRHAEHLFRRHGIWLILGTRFIPGTRTATYFAGGALRAPFMRFVGIFALAAAVWTPFLVGLSFFVGRELLGLYEVYEALVPPALIAAGLLLYFIFHYGIPLLTWKGRRRLKGKWMRATRWEFWPWWQVNWLVFLYVLYLGLFRYRRPALFTATNPCMLHSGFIGESKGAILESLSGAGEAIPPWKLLGPGEPESRWQAFESAMQELQLVYPVVLKPDEGQRGAGVKVVRNSGEARAWLETTAVPAILQTCIEGREYGVFYERLPSESKGRISSVTIKEQLSVTGNGVDSLEILIYAHPRAIALLGMFVSRFEDELDDILPKGQVKVLGELGTHAMGSLFLDGRHLITPALEERIDSIASACEGFYFGRFDIMVPDEAALKEGSTVRVIELNGITSEETHIYDPRHGLFHAWATLCRQWRTGFEIAAQNAANGHEPAGTWAFLRDAMAAHRRQRVLD
jgi:membrane protein DedA with SNARE-associated domain